MFAIGWFMKPVWRFSSTLEPSSDGSSSFHSAVFMNVPIYDATQQANIPIQDYASGGSASLQMIAFAKTVRTIAIGAIVGGGMFGLFKMWRTFANIFTDIGAAFKGDGSQEYMEGKGWYEWPLKHIPIFMGITFFADHHFQHRWLLAPGGLGLCARSYFDDVHARRHCRACDG